MVLHAAIRGICEGVGHGEGERDGEGVRDGDMDGDRDAVRDDSELCPGSDPIDDKVRDRHRVGRMVVAGKRKAARVAAVAAVVELAATSDIMVVNLGSNACAGRSPVATAAACNEIAASRIAFSPAAAAAAASSAVAVGVDVDAVEGVFATVATCAVADTLCVAPAVEF